MVGIIVLIMRAIYLHFIGRFIWFHWAPTQSTRTHRHTHKKTTEGQLSLSYEHHEVEVWLLFFSSIYAPPTHRFDWQWWSAPYKWAGCGGASFPLWAPKPCKMGPFKICVWQIPVGAINQRIQGNTWGPLHVYMIFSGKPSLASSNDPYDSWHTHRQAVNQWGNGSFNHMINDWAIVRKFVCQITWGRQPIHATWYTLRMGPMGHIRELEGVMCGLALHRETDVSLNSQLERVWVECQGNLRKNIFIQPSRKTEKDGWGRLPYAVSPAPLWDYLMGTSLRLKLRPLHHHHHMRLSSSIQSQQATWCPFPCYCTSACHLGREGGRYFKLRRRG